MLTRHVHEDLTAYHDGELAPDRSRAVAEHLIRCGRCRAAYDDVRHAASMAGRLRVVEAPDDLWEGIESALGDRRPATLSSRRWSNWRPIAAAAAVAVIALSVGIVWYLSRASGPSWEVTALGGTPRIGASGIGEDGQISIGDALVTDGSSRAEIRVGAIGTVDVEPNSRVRLVEATMTEHRLALDRGTLRARIWAPPRLFFVDTPSAVAVDYGCAYTLSVDDAGATLLHVTSGWVALELNGRDSLVPAGALCSTRPGQGLGTPYFDDAATALRDALSRYDFEAGGSAALDEVLGSARSRDSLTLWYLLARSAAGDRERVYDRLAALSPPPGEVRRADVLALDESALDLWRSSLESTW